MTIGMQVWSTARVDMAPADVAALFADEGFDAGRFVTGLRGSWDESGRIWHGDFGLVGGTRRYELMGGRNGWSVSLIEKGD